MSDSEDEFASADEGDGVPVNPNSKAKKEKSLHSETKAIKTDKSDGSSSAKSATVTNTSVGVEKETKKGAVGKGSQKKAQPKKTNKNKADDGKQETESAKSIDKGKKTNASGKTQAPKSNTAVKGSGSPAKGKKKQSDDTVASSSPVSGDGDHKKEVIIESDKHEETSDIAVSSPDTSTQSSESEVKKTRTPSGTTTDMQEEIATQKSKETTPQKEGTTQNLKDVSNTSTETKHQDVEDVSSQNSEELKTQTKAEGKEQSSASSGWSAWGNWGSSLMDVASHSVTTFTSQVEDGFNTLVDAVETSMGAPTPEELAEMKRKSKVEAEAPENTPMDREVEGDQKEKEKTMTEGEGDNPVSPVKEQSPEEQAKGNWFSSLADHVGGGLNTLMDAVETSMGAPSPAELAEMKKQGKVEAEAPENTTMDREKEEGDHQENEEKEEQKTGVNKTSPVREDKGAGGSWFSSWGMSSLTSVVQNTTNIVQNTSNALVTGSLDVLENIGKKTYDVIKDHDPGLRKTKEVLFHRGDKPNLSQILRDAKEDSVKRIEMEKESDEARKAHFGFMFDEYQGLSHLEALEILSNQCEKKVQTLLASMPADTLADIKSDLIRIKQVFERNEEDNDDEEPEDQDFVKLVTDILTNLHLGTSPDKLNRCQEKIRQSISKLCTQEGEEEQAQPKAVHQVAIQSLAELTSKSVEQFHKAGELILLQQQSDVQFTERATSLSNLTNVLCTEVGILSMRFTTILNKLAEGEEDSSHINTLVTNIYLEAGNSSTYIQDAFQLLLPCLQELTIQTALQHDN
ncbi:protein FAM114A2-like [Mizuhopecten yessoensis]|uniref:Protein FAM114A2 n=1 Tax=Mizuhopecten yessoensis TaxID=6573 RepID=A0A210QYP9_MIZYE|nr:protein FAM114A2-like [Mizuhopecten yessoensis]XP_021346228.1 protein FAM114A2-like [Mizuhopecten yessoensis]OWF53898.1 hypothetical protein KP79_PYT13086 [Mizuhopecten yessoensis]